MNLSLRAPESWPDWPGSDRPGRKVGLTVLLGIGNPMRGDDGLGCAVAKAVNERQRLGISRADQPLKALICEEVPENFTADVKELAPGRIILVDAVDFAGQPGEVICVSAENLPTAGGSTHNPGLALLMHYLRAETGAEVVLIGMQPLNRQWRAPLSREVQESVNQLAALLVDGADAAVLNREKEKA